MNQIKDTKYDFNWWGQRPRYWLWQEVAGSNPSTKDQMDIFNTNLANLLTIITGMAYIVIYLHW